MVDSELAQSCDQDLVRHFRLLYCSAKIENRILRGLAENHGFSILDDVLGIQRHLFPLACVCGSSLKKANDSGGVRNSPFTNARFNSGVPFLRRGWIFCYTWCHGRRGFRLARRGAWGA